MTQHDADVHCAQTHSHYNFLEGLLDIACSLAEETIAYMADKRTVDELSVEELERILTIKKREDRQTRLKRMKQSGRVIETVDAALPPQPAPQSNSKQSDGTGLPAATIEVSPDAVSRRKVVPEFEDAIDRQEYVQNDGKAGEIWRKFVDRFLLLIEVGAVLGLILLGVALVNGLNLLQVETAAAQAAADVR